MMNSTVGKVAFYLVIIGAINWGLVGLGNLLGGADYNLVTLIIGRFSPTAEDIVYLLVGIAGVLKLLNCWKGDCCSGHNS